MTARRGFASFDRSLVADLLAVAWSVIAAGWLFRTLFPGTGDDPYITYRYAQNIAEGIGFVYNAGESVLSTTAPLYAMALVVPARFGFDIPAFSAVLGALAIGLGGLVVWRFGRITGAPVAAVVGLLLYPTHYLLFSTTGFETPVFVLLVLTAFLAYASNRFVMAACILAVATAVRGDGAIAAAALAVHYMAMQHRLPPVRAIGAYVACLVPWAAFMIVQAGSPLPITLAAKRAQAHLPDVLSYADRFGLILSNYAARIAFLPHLLLGAIGLVFSVVRFRYWLLFPLWMLVHALAYGLLDVASYGWYYAPLGVAMVTMTAIGTEALYRWTQTRFGTTVAVIVGCVVATALVVPQVQSVREAGGRPDHRSVVYREVGDWLRTHTDPDDSVGALEIGIIGYYGQRRMVDFAGLIQPAVVDHIERTKSYGGAARWAVEHYEPDYVVLIPGSPDELFVDPDIAESCHQVAGFEDNLYEHAVYIAECTWP